MLQEIDIKSEPATGLELDDIQSGVLRPRPTPYVATYIAFRIDDRKAGRELMRRASQVVTSAANPNSPLADTWVSVALTCKGLEALGVPQESLDSLSWEFRQGLAARATELGDVGESAPENWEQPLGSSDIHVVLVAVSPDEQRLEAALDRARETYRNMPGIKAIWRQNCHALASETEPFGFRDGISHPAIEGSGIAGTNPQEQPLKAGEFVLAYRDELGGVQPLAVGTTGLIGCIDTSHTLGLGLPYYSAHLMHVCVCYEPITLGHSLTKETPSLQAESHWRTKYSGRRFSARNSW